MALSAQQKLLRVVGVQLFFRMLLYLAVNANVGSKLTKSET